MRTLYFSLLAVFLMVPGALGDGLFYRLPEDGTYALFNLEWKSGKEGYQGSLTMSSVGQATIKGNKCRWIELKWVIETDDMGDVTEVEKLLIPEKYLKAGVNPLQYVVKGWSKSRGGRVGPRKDFTGKGKEYLKWLPPLLSGPLQNVKKLKNETLETPLGKLSCPGITGSKRYEVGFGNKIHATFENRLNDMAPFGLVNCKMTWKVEANGRLSPLTTMTFKLVKVGKGAESELPDQK